MIDKKPDMLIVRTTQPCGCVLNEDGQLLERIDGCAIPHVEEGDDTAKAKVAQEMSLDQVVARCEAAALRFNKKSPHRLLFFNCANAFRQLGATIDSLGKQVADLTAENDELRKTNDTLRNLTR